MATFSVAHIIVVFPINDMDPLIIYVSYFVLFDGSQ